MRTAIYGGSFNPPHLGHLEAARTVYESLKPDSFLIIPDREPPHKELAVGSPTPYERLELCEINFRSIPGCTVTDMELKREGKSYTADTIAQLKAEGAEDIHVVMGTDMLLSFEEWYRFQYLLENCTLAVLAREDDDHEELEAQKRKLEELYGGRIEILSHEPLPMSSSEIRSKLRLRMGAELLEEEVYRLIIRKGYYEALPELSWLRSEAYRLMSSTRVAHAAGCESEAVMLAMHWGEDPEAAATAGILHDITKKLSLDEQLILCEKYGIILDSAMLSSPQIIHAVTGAAMAADRFGVSEEISRAIRWHTTGKSDMTSLEKIIYLADIIEPSRDFEGVEELRELAYEDLDRAMAVSLERSIERIRMRGAEPYKDTIDACQWYNTLE